MEQPQYDPTVVKQVEQDENEKFQRWQEQQSMAYLNNRVLELGIENRTLRQRILELEDKVQFLSGSETEVPETIEAEEKNT